MFQALCDNPSYQKLLTILSPFEKYHRGTIEIFHIQCKISNLLKFNFFQIVLLSFFISQGSMENENTDPCIQKLGIIR